MDGLLEHDAEGAVLGRNNRFPRAEVDLLLCKRSIFADIPHSFNCNLLIQMALKLGALHD